MKKVVSGINPPLPGTRVDSRCMPRCALPLYWSVFASVEAGAAAAAAGAVWLRVWSAVAEAFGGWVTEKKKGKEER